MESNIPAVMKFNRKEHKGHKESILLRVSFVIFVFFVAKLNYYVKQKASAFAPVESTPLLRFFPEMWYHNGHAREEEEIFYQNNQPPSPPLYKPWKPSPRKRMNF